MELFYRELFVKGGPAALAVAALGFLTALGFWGWVALRYTRLRSATRSASEWARSDEASKGGPPDGANAFLVELTPLAWGSADHGWRTVDRIRSSAEDTLGAMSRLDRTAILLMVLALAAVAATGFAAWQEEVHLAAAAGMDFWDFLDGESAARGLDARGLAQSLSRGMITAMLTLIFLVGGTALALITAILAFMEGPASRLERVEWLAAAALERRDPGNAARWGALRERVEERHAAQWSWAALLFPWAWLPANGFVWQGIVWVIVMLIPVVGFVTGPAALYLAIRGNRHRLQRCRARSRPLF